MQCERLEATAKQKNYLQQEWTRPMRAISQMPTPHGYRGLYHVSALFILLLLNLSVNRILDEIIAESQSVDCEDELDRDSERGWMLTKDWSREWGSCPQGRQRRKGRPSGLLRNKSTVVF
jgi:hypothetical protein